MKGKEQSFLMGNFIILDQWETQEQDGRISSGGTQHRCEEYGDGGDELLTEKNGGVTKGDHR
jgi:hypothetical protein